MDRFGREARQLSQIGADTAGQELLRKPALAFARLASGQVRALSIIGPAAGKAPGPANGRLPLRFT